LTDGEIGKGNFWKKLFNAFELMSPAEIPVQEF